MTGQLERLREYNTVIDVRSPAEFARDHLPGAVSMPVLADRQREIVGILHKSDEFAARRLGARMVAGNIGDLLEGKLADKPPGCRFLIYCWRGGMRSASLVSVLGMVGWQAEALRGGYRAYRARVREIIDELPGKIPFLVLAGATGAGKTALLGALPALGVQVLDLEALAHHKGSLFGSLGEQPTQRMFESLLAEKLRGFDPRLPVAVEAESRRIGKVVLPARLHEAMRCAQVATVDARRSVRAARLAREYACYADAALFADALDGLARYVPKSLLAEWRSLHRSGQIERLAGSLLEHHYDTAYKRSLGKHFGNGEDRLHVAVKGPSPADIGDAAQRLAKLLAAVREDQL